MLGIYVVTGDFSKVIGIVSLTPFGTVADYALTTIPMFILMAYLSASSGLARDLYRREQLAGAGARRPRHRHRVRLRHLWRDVRRERRRGFRDVENRHAEMRRHGYSEELAAGSIGIGATLDILIPPSIAMVIYGVATQTSIGEL